MEGNFYRVFLKGMFELRNYTTNYSTKTFENYLTTDLLKLKKTLQRGQHLESPSIRFVLEEELCGEDISPSSFPS